MKRLINYALGYAIAAMLSGVFYREFTKFNGFTGVTILGKVHTHLFTLGMMIFLIAALFTVHTSMMEQKQFKLFMITYNIGLLLTTLMMLARGILQVLEVEFSAGISATISGVSGVGHILTSLGIILLLLSLRKVADH